MKRLLALFMIFILIASLLNSLCVFADSSSEIIFRNDNLETHSIGSVFPILNIASFGGVVTSQGKGGLQVTSSGDTIGEIITTTDKNNNSTKALKVSSTTKVNSIFQFLNDAGVSASQTYSTNKKYIYKLSLKGDATNNVSYVEIGKARLYLDTGRIDMIADSTAVPAVTLETYNNVFNCTNNWFDFTYIVNKPNDTVSIYINDELKITKTYGGIFNKADGVKNTNPRVYISGATTGGIVYIDNIYAASPKNLPDISQDILDNLACESNSYWDTESDILTDNPTFTVDKLLDPNYLNNKKGAVASTTHVSQGTNSLKWYNHPYYPTLSTKRIPTNISDFNNLSFKVYSSVRTNEEITLMLYSNSNTTAWLDGYLYTFTIDFAGTRTITIPFSNFKKYETPSGWNKIDSLTFHTKMFGKQPNPYTEIYMDDIKFGYSSQYPDTWTNPQYVAPVSTHRTVEFDQSIMNHSFPEVAVDQSSPFQQQAYFKAERATMGYYPKFNPGVISFDKNGKLYMKFGATVIQTKDSQGNWTAIDLEPIATDYVQHTLGKNEVLYSDDTSSIDEYIRFDNENDAYITMTVYGNGQAFGLLLHSKDNMVTWDIYKLPYRYSRFERVDGNNTQCMDGPPLILLSDYFIGEDKGAYFILPQKKPDGTLVYPFTPVQYADKSISVVIHSGDANFAVTSNNKIFLAYSICDTTVDLSGQIPAEHPSRNFSYIKDNVLREFRNGTPTFIKEYDLVTHTLSQPVFVGFGGTAMDNHNWPALSIDNQGYLHLIANGHHDPFYYTKSSAPNSIANWEDQQIVGSGTTYASLNIDKENNAFVVTRNSSSGYTFNLTMFNKQGSGAWSSPIPIVKKYGPYYNVFRHRMTMDKNGRLYMYYQSQSPLKEIFKDELDAGTFITPENYKAYIQSGDLLPVGTYTSSPRTYQMSHPVLREPVLLVSNNPSRTSFKLALTSDLNDVVVDATTSNYVVRSDDFEGYSIGNLDGTNNLSLSDGTLFKSTLSSSNQKGGWQLTSSNGAKFDLVQTLGSTGQQTKALKIARDTTATSTAIFGIGTSGYISNNGKVVWETVFRSGGDGNNGLNSILIDKIRYYPSLGRIDFVADATASPSVTARTNIATPSTSGWFKLRYEVDYSTETVSIYINDVFKASQKYGGKYPTNYLTNSTLRMFVESGASTLPSAIFIDSTKVYSPGNTKTLAIESTIPQDNSENVAINQPITINFNKPVNSSTLSTIRVIGENDTIPRTISQLSYNSANAVKSLTITLQDNLEFPKKYFVDLSGVLDIDGNAIVTTNQQFSFATSSQGMLVLQYDDFEDYSIGNVMKDKLADDINPPTKTEDGTEYSIFSLTPKLAGGIIFNASKFNCEVNLVETTDNFGNKIKALQSKNSDNVEGNTTQIKFNNIKSFEDIKKLVLKVRIRGSANNETAVSTNIGNVKIDYLNNQLIILGDGLNNSQITYNNVLPNLGSWFDIQIQIDKDNNLELVYINNNLIASQVNYENNDNLLSDITNFNDYTMGGLNSTYIDKIEVYAFKQSNDYYFSVPTFTKNGKMIDNLNSDSGIISAQTYFVNNNGAKDVCVVYALYNNDILVDANIVQKEVSTCEKSVFNCEFNLQGGYNQNYKINVLFVENMINVKPLNVSYMITSENGTWK